jgi:hypothetical protein
MYVKYTLAFVGTGVELRCFLERVHNTTYRSNAGRIYSYHRNEVGEIYPHHISDAGRMFPITEMRQAGFSSS